jgi:hypothetical protein
MEQNSTTWWVFGDTSEYAGHVTNYLENNNQIIVERFNRSNTDYFDPAGFIESIKDKPMPDKIWFNANIQEPDFDYSKPIIEQHEHYKHWMATFEYGYWFKMCLLEYLEDKITKGTFILSTSGIAMDHGIHRDTKLYRILRKSEYSLMNTYGGSADPDAEEGFVVCGMCVSNMQDHQRKKYGEFVADYFINGNMCRNGVYSINADESQGRFEMIFKQRGWGDV